MLLIICDNNNIKFCIIDYNIMSNTIDYNTMSDAITIKNHNDKSMDQYYLNRDEFVYVGIVEETGIFKIRKALKQIILKNRNSSLETEQNNNKFLIDDVAKKINLTINDGYNGEVIKNKLFDLEKYSTTKDKNKKTYFIDKSMSYPLNLEDRIERMIDDINSKMHSSSEIKFLIVPNKNEKRFDDINYVSYVIQSDMQLYENIMKSYGAIKIHDEWIIE